MNNFNEEYYVGQIGFAQVGRDDYYDRWRIEKKVMRKAIEDNEFLQIPIELYRDVQYRFKSNPHDFGTYYDLVVRVSFDISSQLEEQFNLWFDKAQSFNWESEQMMEMCRALWHDQNQMEIIHDKRDNPLNKVE